MAYLAAYLIFSLDSSGNDVGRNVRKIINIQAQKVEWKEKTKESVDVS